MPLIHPTNKMIIAGPCVVESRDLCMQIAEKMKRTAEELQLNYIFKASYDKANRTSASSFRSIGIDESLKILQEVKTNFQVPVITDIHESAEIHTVAEVADILQIPAFLCRQTTLLIEAGKTGKTVNIKKGQFMDPKDMQFAVDKVKSTGNSEVLLTERGTFFGYGQLVVDFRSIPIMRSFAPVIFDVTHSIQQPGALGGKSGGDRSMAPYLARAAAAVGVDGFFIETHPDPSTALSDGPNMIPLSEMKSFLQDILQSAR
jgi:2-dehydro-3-deoxyphosphooctonate aldolase (KDO 8-P synthase)